MEKFNFELNVWVTFTLNEISCIGRTLILDLDGIPTEMIGAVDSAGMCGHIRFSEAKNLKKLMILKETQADKEYKKVQKEAQKLDENYDEKNAKALDLFLIFNKDKLEA